MPRLRSEPLMAYRLNVGMDYGGKRHEAGEIVNDIPNESVLWLIDQRYIEAVPAQTVREEVND